MRQIRWTPPAVSGALVGVALSIAAALTLMNVSVKGPGLSFWFAKGTFRIDRTNAIGGWRGHPFAVRIDGGPRVEIGCVPLALAGLALVGVSICPRHARRRPGRCPNCEYDLRGLSGSAVCPECGACALSSRGSVSPAA